VYNWRPKGKKLILRRKELVGTEGKQKKTLPCTSILMKLEKKRLNPRSSREDFVFLKKKRLGQSLEYEDENQKTNKKKK
jgi:hypothetical protein